MSQARQSDASALVADIGGTNARFALADLGTLELADFWQIRCAEHPNLEDAVGAYVARLDSPPEQAAIAVAAPVTGDEIKLTNSVWSVTIPKLRSKFNLKRVHALNDFEALALSLPHLTEGDLHQIGGAVPLEHATKAVLGPGTGLGVAGLAWSGKSWVALAGEGGHMTLGAGDERELALLERIRKGRDHLSAERLLSGPGLAELYRAVALSRGLTPVELEPNGVLEQGMSGEDEVAAEALELFVAWLGRFAGDAALMLGARGGLYIGGGIAPKIAAKLSAGEFRRAFENKGRMAAYLEPVPVYVITAEFATLKGAAASLRDLTGK